MPAPTNAKLIEVIRLGNPWLVGHNVSRVVPVYAIHNVVSPDFARDDRVQSVKDLAYDASVAINTSLSASLNVEPPQQNLWVHFGSGRFPIT